jgi:hypothetical protein
MHIAPRGFNPALDLVVCGFRDILIPILCTGGFLNMGCVFLTPIFKLG